MINVLQVSRTEFVSTTKPFTKKRAKLDRALLVYDGALLSIESGVIAAVMRSTGEWHGQRLSTRLDTIGTVEGSNAEGASQ